MACFRVHSILLIVFFIDDAMNSLEMLLLFVFTLKTVPISTQYLLTSVLVQLTRTPSMATG